MKTHFEYLAEQLPDLREASILDVGSGKGAFLLDAVRHNAKTTGLEMSEAYIKLTHERLSAAGYTAQIVQGVAEKMPLPDQAFDFINICEVIEHVENPEAMLREVFRVLRPGGHVYLSAPNRFGMRDQHFHLYFVNWLPRVFADYYISFWRDHKDYADTSAGRQRLADMHYYTYRTILRLLKNVGFTVEDIRITRIRKEMRGTKRIVATMAYPLARSIYLDAFHLLLEKPQKES
ncbi:MAG TPA: methyltransferase domain-containing protein [Candidatus Paceibacterota bacterium]